MRSTFPVTLGGYRACAIVPPVTLKDIAESLPNGFHDSKLNTMKLDIEHAALEIEVEIDISDTDRRSPILRRARVRLYGVKAFMCGDIESLTKFPNKVKWLDGFETTSQQVPALMTLPIEIQSRLYTFFAVTWSCFIHVAADEANLDWI